MRLPQPFCFNNAFVAYLSFASYMYMKYLCQLLCFLVFISKYVTENLANPVFLAKK